MTSSSDNCSYLLGPYRITYPCHMAVATYRCEWYDGIILRDGAVKYDLVNNYHMGTRLLISEPPSRCKDVPFYSDTFWLLPAGVTAEKEDQHAR